MPDFAALIRRKTDPKGVRSQCRQQTTPPKKSGSLNSCRFRQLCLNIPILLLMDMIFGMTGIVWTQMTADMLDSIVSYVIYSRIIRKIC